MTETEPRGNRRARLRGALASLVPFGAIVLLYSVSGSGASPDQVAASLAWTGAIAVVAGFLAGPLVVRGPHGHRVGVFGYALALIATTGVVNLVQTARETWASQGFDPLAIAGAVAGRAAYGLISTLYLLIPALVLGAMWTLAVWALERLTGEPPPPPPSPSVSHAERDPRRLGLGAAGIITGYAIVIAVVSAGARGPGELGPPEAVSRPLLLAALCTLPAAIAVIGAIRRSRPILVAAGVLCFAQSFVAFSGVTIPFVVPAFLLLALGAGGSVDGTMRRAFAGGALVVVLGLGAWVATFALTETICWTARTAPDGTIVNTSIPVPETMTSGSNSGSGEIGVAPGDFASGCAGGQLTLQGAGLAAVLWVGAVAIAARLAVGPVRSRVSGRRRGRSARGGRPGSRARSDPWVDRLHASWR